ncbi:unnamed protein product, partial [marine sediment metagenome]
RVRLISSGVIMIFLDIKIPLTVAGKRPYYLVSFVSLASLSGLA